MYYINDTPTENGNYGNPQSSPGEGRLALPDELLSDYIDSMGFVELTTEDGIVTAVSRNEEAYAAYIDEHPVTPEPAPEPTEEDDVNAMLVDHEYRLTLLELGV